MKRKILAVVCLIAAFALVSCETMSSSRRGHCYGTKTNNRMY